HANQTKPTTPKPLKTHASHGVSQNSIFPRLRSVYGSKSSGKTDIPYPGRRVAQYSSLIYPHGGDTIGYIDIVASSLFDGMRQEC
ncbi:hypothetical protein, partial [Bifidobacterium saimiriisciurei]|uniref:hypothetical protein n=1 Tax=Bifidobacterium saimiriisciurei TaxID=2661627 RepID=UPI001CDD2B06